MKKTDKLKALDALEVALKDNNLALTEELRKALAWAVVQAILRK